VSVLTRKVSELRRRGRRSWTAAATLVVLAAISVFYVASSGAVIFSNPAWQVTHVGDFDGNGKSDLVWRNNTTGQTATWLMNGTTPASSAVVLTDVNWAVTHVADTNGDGKSDLLWRNAATGATTLWLMNGNSFSSFATLITDPTWLLSPPNGL